MSGARVEAGNGSVRLSESERIKERSQGLRAPLAEELENDRSHLSEEAKQVLKFHGSYQQDDRDVRRQRRKAGLEPDYSFMIRSKIPGGVLTAAQFLGTTSWPTGTATAPCASRPGRASSSTASSRATCTARSAR